MDESRISGVTMNWSGDAVLCFGDGMILPGRLDRELYPQYYRWREDWPCEPTTGVPLKIWSGSAQRPTAKASSLRKWLRHFLRLANRCRPLPVKL